MPNLRFYIRTEGSSRVGLGHLYRTLALARKIKEAFGIKPIFWLSGGAVAVKLVKGNGFSLKRLGLSPSPKKEREAISSTLRNGSFSIWVVDLPRLRGYESVELKGRGLLLTIANEKLNKPAGDMIIDVLGQIKVKQSLKKNLYLPGPSYQILREEFLFYRRRYKPRKNLKHILITFGGSDPCGATVKLVKIIPRLPPELSFTLLIGPAFSYGLSAPARPPNLKIISSSREMARLMSQYDLCISGFGVTAFELACLGVPTLVVGQVDRELNFIRYFCRRSGAINLGSHRQLSSEGVKRAMASVMDFRAREKMWRQARRLVDGRGLERIINAIGDLIIKKARTN